MNGGNVVVIDIYYYEMGGWVVGIIFGKIGIDDVLFVWWDWWIVLEIVICG